MAVRVNTNCQKKLIKSKSGLKIVVFNQKEQSPFTLEEPPWIPDSEVATCSACKVKFKFTTRKHHCRRCGLIFCSGCCWHRERLPRMCFMDPVRVCNYCVPTCQDEATFFDNALPILQSGATFLLSPIKSVTATCLCLCQLSSSHQCLNFDSAANLPPLSVETVSEYSIFDNPETGATCIDIISGSGGLRLTTAGDNHRSSGISWIHALHRAFSLINITHSPTPP